MRRAAFAALVAAAALLAPEPAAARDYSTLYDDAFLATKARQYSAGLRKIFEQDIKPSLTLEERRAAQDVRIEVPLRGTERDPFEFYAGGGVIYMPAMSIRFLADLAVAAAWLQVNQYSLETLVDYVSMLKYQEPTAFGGRYPDPSRALRIPPGAENDARVTLLADQFYDHAVYFIFLHELAHVIYRHPGNGSHVPPAVSRANEEQADAFALEVLRRIGQPTNGMLIWFLASAHFVPHRADFGSDAEYERELAKTTHPLTAARMRRLAVAMRTHAADFARRQNDPGRAAQSMRDAARLIETEVVPVLADVDQQRLMAMRGTTMTLAGLQPRRLGESLAMPQPAAGGGTLAFDGVYDGVFTDRGAEFNVRTILRRRGDAVTGSYGWGAGEGAIDGVIEGDTLVYRWRAGNQAGRGRARASPDGSRVEGTWGSGERSEGRGTWIARRGAR